MINFSIDNNRSFHLRSVGIIKNNGRVLFQRPIGSEKWFLPGGRVEFFESSESTLKRELMEELNLKIDQVNLCWVVEYFLEVENKQVHEVGMHYLVEIPKGNEFVNKEHEFEGMEEGYLHKWIQMNELENYKIVPGFVVPKLLELDETGDVKHTVLKAGRSYGKDNDKINID